MSLQVAPERRPNILFILTDQQRWDTLGCLGNPHIQTPHLDNIARDGVTYPQTFCTFPVCTPSRYSLLSGLAVHQHGGSSNRCTLAPGIATFPRLLREAGWRTRAVGKMHFTPTYLDVGFDSMVLAEQDGDGRMDDDYHRDLRQHGLLDRLDLQDQRAEFRARAPGDYWEAFGAQTSDLPEAWHSTTWVADRAMEALSQWDTDGGNLLMASFIKPHHPFDPPAPWDAMYDAHEIPLLPGWTETVPDRDRFQGYFSNDDLTDEAARRITALYYASISQIDYHVGRMTELLKARGLYDDTLVVFTSDHGEYLGFHHLLLKSGPMYDPLMRVPLLIKFPQNRQAGQLRRDTLVSLVDLAPTILRHAGIASPSVMRGLDLSEPTANRPYVFASAMGQRYVCRSRTHKLLLARDPENCAFFDMGTDPLELTDLFHHPDQQESIDEFRHAIADWLLFDAPHPSTGMIKPPVSHPTREWPPIRWRTGPP